MLFFTPVPIKKKIERPQGNLGNERIPPQCWQKHQLGWRPGSPVLYRKGLVSFLS